MAEPATLLTVGHSNHTLEHFLALLRAHDVQGIADVRSWPASRYTPWFDSGPLADALREAGVQYAFLGGELGGRPHDRRLYDQDGHVRYDVVARSEAFALGLDKLRRGIEMLRVAVMCAEENPEHCHRRLLVARVLYEEGVPVLHIRGDGRQELEGGFIRLDSLFEESLPWRSTASVSRRRRPSTSSVG
ncbi:MAG TPA: DUF488 domain-containing protein [Solirubrobacteraceae bacterium]|jgi:uncharacterized protein (DUF488 family)|nr:DUF488 domain-containing protein [Solirubrobacteraceae bacterium]